jgi:(4-O-methyl)-D-glucuronate---lignin esterase
MNTPARFGFGRMLGLACLLVIASRPCQAAAGLAAGFADPPPSARPRTWWHWVSGNVSSAGVTADLEAMKRIGLGGAQLFTVDQSDVKGPVAFMSPQWLALVHQAIAESARLHLELAMEVGEGWSESGGPWVAPAESMQRVVWSEAEVTGGRSVALAVPQPLTIRGYYRDIALFAFPAQPGDVPPGLARLASSAVSPDAPVRLPLTVPLPTPAQPQWIRLEYPRPEPFRSFRIETADPLRDLADSPAWELQVSEDGRVFRRVCSVPDHGTAIFPAVVGRYFRLWMPSAPPRATRLRFTALVLAGARLPDAEAQAGMAVDRRVNDFPQAGFPAAEAIPPGSLINLTGRAEWNAPPGEWTLLRIGHTSTGVTNHPAAPATVGLECDKLSAAAVTDDFERGMLGTVIRQAGPLAGEGLRYILCDSWEAGCENWTPLIREEFRQRWGYDLEPWLPALTGRVLGSVEQTERFLWDYRRLLADLVARNHYGVLRELAHRHHLGLYAEAVGINLPTVADELQCKGETDIPMGEFWVGEDWPGLTPVADAKEASSAAHLYGQTIAAAEAFTARPEFGSWSKDPYALKALGDLEFCLGINRFVFHRYAAQPWPDRRPGMSMGPWGTNFERTNTWWEPAAAWMTYLSRCEFLLQRGRFVADACYDYGEGAPVSLLPSALTPRLPAGYDYDACDTEILLRFRVQAGRLVLPSGMSYRVLVLPDTGRMTLAVARQVRSLVAAGATIVGPRPERSPSLAGYPGNDRALQAIAAEVWGDCDGRTVTEHRYGLGRVVWGRPLAGVLGVPPDFSSPDPNLRYLHRRDGGTDLYFVSNQARRAIVVQCAFRADGRLPELWHPDTGEIQTAADFTVAGGVTRLPIRLDPVGSVFVVFRRPSAGFDPVVAVGESADAFAAPESDGQAPLLEPPVAGPSGIALTAWRPARYVLRTASGRVLQASSAGLPPPLFVGGPWELTFPPGLGAPPRATLGHLESWTASSVDGVRFFSGTATYHREVDLPADFFGPGRRQYLDLGRVENLARVRLNGRDLGVLWKEPFRIEITGAARPGANRLEVAVTNLWPNRMIGDSSLPPGERVTWASVEPYRPGSPLLPSGLLGPVLIRGAVRLEPR